MSSKTKFVFSIGMALLLCPLLAGPSRAGAIYQYDGNDFTSCSGTYCDGGPYALTITLDTTLSGAQLDNLKQGLVAGGDLTAFVSSFSFSDGNGLTITQANATSIFFDVATNSGGAITGYDVYAQLFPSGVTGLGQLDGVVIPPEGATDSATTLSCTTDGCATIGEGSSADNPAQWALTNATTETPEPSSMILFGSGLSGLFLLAARRKLRSQPTFPG